MGDSNFRRRAAVASVVAAFLCGCGGSQFPVAGPNTLPQTRIAVADSEHDGSWMLAEAKSQNLLYVTNYSYVSVYSYPGLKLIGALKDFKSTVGACVDGKGNVFITNHVYAHGHTRIAEYAHGGSKPITELANDDRIGPIGCSVDPVSGNLAVSGGGSSRGVGVNIFSRARGKPLFIRIPGMVFDDFCAYDARGDLFVDGEKSFSHRGPALAELPKGSKTFEDIKLDAAIDPGGGVQWDGEHVAVGAYFEPKSQHTPAIYQFAVHGGSGKKVGTTTLGDPAYTTSFQFDILAGSVVIPNWPHSGRDDVLVYRYPAGGSPTASLTRDISVPRGVAVSLASP
jgi:hypothetical protein